MNGRAAVSAPGWTVTSPGRTPRASATIWAATVRCPCPCGVDVKATLTPPPGSMAIVTVSALPSLGSVVARCSGRSTSVM